MPGRNSILSQVDSYRLKRDATIQTVCRYLLIYQQETFDRVMKKKYPPLNAKQSVFKNYIVCKQGNTRYYSVFKVDN